MRAMGMGPTLSNAFCTAWRFSPCDQGVGAGLEGWELSVLDVYTRHATSLVCLLAHWNASAQVGASFLLAVSCAASSQQQCCLGLGGAERWGPHRVKCSLHSMTPLPLILTVRAGPRADPEGSCYVSGWPSCNAR